MLAAPPNTKQDTNPPLVFVLPYFPQVHHSNLKRALSKHWHIIEENDYLKSLFPAPPLLAYKRQKNIKDTIIRARLQDPTENDSLKELDEENLQILIELLEEQQYLDE